MRMCGSASSAKFAGRSSTVLGRGPPRRVPLARLLDKDPELWWSIGAVHCGEPDMKHYSADVMVSIASGTCSRGLRISEISWLWSCSSTLVKTCLSRSFASGTCEPRGHPGSHHGFWSCGAHGPLRALHGALQRGHHHGFHHRSFARSWSS